MKLKRIHHIAILTDNYQLSKKFYTEILGLEIINEVFREARQSYKLDLAINGDYCIELFSFPEYRQRASWPEAKGLRHLAFAVDDVEGWISKLKEAGVDIQDIRIDETTGKKFTFFYDPNGQPLELYEE